MTSPTAQSTRARVLVVGASGQVGRAVLRGLATSYDVVAAKHNREVTARTVVPVPVTPEEWRELHADLRPSAVVIAAAISDVDACERDPARSRTTNLDLVLTAAEVASEYKAHVVHFSTDYVFDGAAGPYREDDVPRPPNVYGMHKLASEQAVVQAGGAVLRTSLVYGASREGAIDRMVHLLRAGPVEFSPVQLSTPTWAPDLAWLTSAVVATRFAGVLHAAGPNTLPRLEVARHVAWAAGLPAEHVRPAMATHGTPAPPGVAERPVRCGLVVDRARDLFGYRPVSLREGLALHLTSPTPGGYATQSERERGGG